MTRVSVTEYKATVPSAQAIPEAFIAAFLQSCSPLSSPPVIAH
jgi:hypothetical protein